MNKEIGFLGVSLVVLLGGSYASWSKDSGASRSTGETADEKVTIIAAKPEQLRQVSWITKTQTIAVTEREDTWGKKYAWFSLESSGSKRGFVGNDQVKAMFEGFAPFTAIRSLGVLSEAELNDAKLSASTIKLLLRYVEGDRVFQIGGRTYGSRDYYVRARGGKEVLLVASKVLSELEYPDGKFMMRKIRSVPDKEVSHVLVKAGAKEKRFLHKNRHADKDAYWTDPDKADERHSAFESWIQKVDSLAASRYGTDERPLPKGDKVLEVEYYEEDKLRERVVLLRSGSGKPMDMLYMVISDATHVPSEVPRSTAEQVEQELAQIFAN